MERDRTCIDMCHLPHSDVDECDLATHDCDTNALCKNTFGSFSCSCKFGYVGNGSECSEFVSKSRVPG